MAICPRDFKPCIDDICYAGDCWMTPGMPPMVTCDGCGGLIGLDGSDPIDDCTCDMVDYGWDDDERP